MTLTNPTTNTEAGAVADVAAKLTEAQRVALVRQVSSWGGQYQGITSWLVGRVLMNEGLIKFAPDPRSSETYLTPLGIAVRQHLEQGATEGGCRNE